MKNQFNWSAPAGISRTTYTLGGQTIATRVTGDRMTTNNGLFYIFSDHLGSTSVLATSSGNQAAGSKTAYYPFGSPRTTPTQTITDRNFTGQKENLELGLLYYNARFYIPAIARFLTPDTIVPDPLNPQSYNRFSYVENNPMNFVDPTGHCKGTEYENDQSGCITWLQEKYGVVIGNWQSSDMSLLWALHESLEHYFSLLGNNLFATLFSSKKFDYYTTSDDISFGGIAGNNGVSLFGNLEKISIVHTALGITDAYLNTVLVIAHEMAHFIINPVGTTDSPNGLNGVFEAFIDASGWMKVGPKWIRPIVDTPYGTISTATPYSILTAGSNPAAEDTAESLALSLVIGPQVLHPYSANILAIVHQVVYNWYWSTRIELPNPSYCNNVCY